MRKIILGTLALLVIANAGTEEDIFRSGIQRTFDVMEHQKDISMDSSRAYSGKYCYLLHPKSGEAELSDMDIVKLEAMSILLEDLSPIYYQDKEKNKKFCFVTAKTKSAFKASTKFAESKFEKLKLYSPTVVKIDKEYIPLLPKLGVWRKDLTPSFNLLNGRLSDLEEDKKVMTSKLKKIKILIDDTFSELETKKSKMIKVAQEVKEEKKSKNIKKEVESSDDEIKTF